MIDRTHAEMMQYRLSICALRYYPDKPTQEPGYTIDDDIDWCLDALPTLPSKYRETMRARVTEVIQDPTAHREAFCRDLYALVPH